MPLSRPRFGRDGLWPPPSRLSRRRSPPVVPPPLLQPGCVGERSLAHPAITLSSLSICASRWIPALCFYLFLGNSAWTATKVRLVLVPQLDSDRCYQRRPVFPRSASPVPMLSVSSSVEMMEWYSTPLLCHCSNITFSFLTSRLHILSASFYRVSTIHVEVNAETIRIY